jgi:hypothetical protein
VSIQNTGGSVDEALGDFFTYVIHPLKLAAKAGKTNQVLQILQDVKWVVSHLERECRSASVTETDERPGLAPKPVLGADPLSDTGATPLDKWLSKVRSFSGRDRSHARGIEILRTIHEAHGAVSLSDLHNRLIALGLSDGAGLGRVTTQISRLKKLKLVSLGAPGRYSRTEGTEAVLQERRRTYGSLFVPDDVRTMSR